MGYTKTLNAPQPATTSQN